MFEMNVSTIGTTYRKAGHSARPFASPDSRTTAGWLMGWGRIDDGFDDHRKVMDLLEYDQGAAAVGLWTLCFTWAHRNTRKPGKTPGLIPASLPRRFVGPIARELAGMLVKVGLWEERGDDGWQIHDFDRYLPTEHTREARAEAGRKGAAKRWGSKRGDSQKQTDDKLTENHSNLPSEPDNEPEPSHNAASNPVANDDSRTPAHRAISNEIAPAPTPAPVPDVLPLGDEPSAEGRGQGEGAPPKRSRQPRGTRLPDDFRVTPEMVTWAKQRCPNVDGRTETEKFVNHWSNKPGRDALKLDWTKAWQNWMLTAEQQAPKNRASPHGNASTPDLRREWERNRS
jgi:hypothetical protein